MSFWTVALTETRREKVAARFLTLAGYTVYCPWLGTKRSPQPLFPGYLFVEVVSGWWNARWSVGVRAIVGVRTGEPARVPDRIIAELRSRERNGLIQLPQKPGLRSGAQVRIKAGPFTDHLAIYDGMRGPDRVAVLLALLGSLQRVELARSDVSPV